LDHFTFAVGFLLNPLRILFCGIVSRMVSDQARTEEQMNMKAKWLLALPLTWGLESGYCSN